MQLKLWFVLCCIGSVEMRITEKESTVELELDPFKWGMVIGAVGVIILLLIVILLYCGCQNQRLQKPVKSVSNEISDTSGLQSEHKLCSARRRVADLPNTSEQRYSGRELTKSFHKKLRASRRKSKSSKEKSSKRRKSNKK